MPERIRERLDDNDTIAAAQILSWIARPHRRLESSFSLLLPSEKKPYIVESQRPAFRKDFLRGLEAGRWFDAKALAADPDWESRTLFPPEHSSTRRMARRSASRLNLDEDNAIKRVWSKRKPIAHIASAARTALVTKSLVNDLLLDPWAFVADPDWVQGVIHEAERRLALACEVGAFDASGFVQFHRDNF
jgi:hypothetical protein